MKKKVIFIISSIIIILLLGIIILLKLLNFNPSKVDEELNIYEAYDVKVCIDKLYIYYKNNIDLTPSSIYDLLDDEYIKYYNLTEENIKEKLEVINSDAMYIKNVYKLQQNSKISTYYVNCIQLYKDNDDEKEFNIILKLDEYNNAFSVFLDDYIKDNNLSFENKISISLRKIKVNKNNQYDKHKGKNIQNVEDIFQNYKNICTFYEKYSYDLIDEECKKLKFVNYETFDKYSKERYRDIVTMRLLSYEYIQKDGYIEYRCKSSNGLIYIFKVKSFITYTVTIE